MNPNFYRELLVYFPSKPIAYFLCPKPHHPILGCENLNSVPKQFTPIHTQAHFHTFPHPLDAAMGTSTHHRPACGTMDSSWGKARLLQLVCGTQVSLSLLWLVLTFSCHK